MIIGLVICLFLFSVGSILNNGVCKGAISVLESSEYLKEEGIEIPSQYKEALDYCMYTN
jgi:hypothetical protein